MVFLILEFFMDETEIKIFFFCFGLGYKKLKLKLHSVFVCFVESCNRATLKEEAAAAAA